MERSEDIDYYREGETGANHWIIAGWGREGIMIGLLHGGETGDNHWIIAGRGKEYCGIIAGWAWEGNNVALLQRGERRGGKVVIFSYLFIIIHPYIYVVISSLFVLFNLKNVS